VNRLDLPLSLPPGAKIVILRALQLGDLLCSIPLFRAIKSQYPECHLSLIGLPWSFDLQKRFPHLIDEIIPFPGWPGLPEQPLLHEEVPAFLSRLQSQNFDLALQAHGSGLYVNQIIELIKPKISAGFYTDTWRPNDTLFIQYPEGIHEIERLLSLAEILGLNSSNTSLEFPLFESDREGAERVMLEHQLDASGYICLHAGSRGADRRWPLTHFSEVATTLSKRGLPVVLTGSKEEMTLVEELQLLIESRGGTVINLAGKTALGTLAALLNTSRLLISNDTGVSHIASALKVPSVVLFTGSDPVRWAPLDRERHRAVHNAFSISAEEVASLALEYLERLP